jgi:hypothetical protein
LGVGGRASQGEEEGEGKGSGVIGDGDHAASPSPGKSVQSLRRRDFKFGLRLVLVVR